MSPPHTVTAAPQSTAPTCAPRPPSALDDERPPRSATEQRWQLRWYGYQTLLADVLSFTLIVGTGEPALVALGLGGAVLAAPIIHFAHGSAWGYLSLALRAVAGVVAFSGFANAIRDEDGDHPSCTYACLEAGLVTYGATVLLDAFVFSVRVRRPAPSSDRVMLSPVFAPGVLGAAAHVAF